MTKVEVGQRYRCTITGDSLVVDRIEGEYAFCTKYTVGFTGGYPMRLDDESEFRFKDFWILLDEEEF